MGPEERGRADDGSDVVRVAHAIEDDAEPLLGDEAIGELGIISRHCASISQRAEILAGVKTPRCGIAVAPTNSPPLEACPMGLGGVFKDFESVSARDRDYSLQIDWLTI